MLCSIIHYVYLCRMGGVSVNIKNEKSASSIISKKRLSGIRANVARLYDHSLTADFINRSRKSFFTLYSRVIGVFFVTFGIYSFLTSLIILLFTPRSADMSAIYGGFLCAVSAFPLLFSKGNVSTLLDESTVGNVICEYFNVRREVLRKNMFSGHTGMAFILGVFLGIGTVIVPFSFIISAVAIIFMFFMVMASPENGITFTVLLLFITDIRLQYALLAVTALSYVLKLIRKKRRMCLDRLDTILLIFVLSTTGAVLFTFDGSIEPEKIGFSVLCCVFFLQICLLRDSVKITRLLNLATVTCGLVMALYILGYAVYTLIPVQSMADRRYLMESISVFPVFKSGFAPLVCASLIPIAVALIIKPLQKKNNFTSWLCLGSMVIFLLVSDNPAYLLSAGVSTAVLLVATGSRRIYIALGTVASLMTVLLYTGSFGDRLYNYLFGQIYDAFDQVKSLSLSSQSSHFYSFSGQGFSENALQTSDFFVSIISRLGVAGFIVFLFFILLVFFEAGRLIVKTYRISSVSQISKRFKGTSSPEEVRLFTTALVCSLTVILICATFRNYYTSSTSYLLLFFVCGTASAYARCTRREMARSESSMETQNTSETSYAVISAAAKE